MLGKRRSIPQDDELHPGPRNRHIHPSQVVQETDLSVLVGTHQADEDDIPFLTLETIHRIDGYQPPEGLEEGISLDELTEVLHLCLVGRNEAEVDAFFQQAFLAYLVDVSF